jgi:hypothetical protein
MGEDDFVFCFTYGVGSFLFEDKIDMQDKYINILKEFRDEGREADIEIGIYEGLINKDKDTFVDAIAAYLKRREEQIAIGENVQIGEDSICIDALALIRLAQELGINVEINHRLTPLELQGNYPDLASYNRVIPKAAPETREPDFWKDWSPVDKVL